METAEPPANSFLFVMDDFQMGKGSYKLAREVKEESKEGNKKTLLPFVLRFPCRL
ncbi:hypothetical protein [Pseudobacillus wudalianchiensis]|uniref:hypothetical protein n=1 Tax=Pseudobacillus wudalianchiensis TaxID=1743143 RepID=UPI00159F2C54|nr:hypothetical protein [Bacillus wudalianchiensis]